MYCQRLCAHPTPTPPIPRSRARHRPPPATTHHHHLVLQCSHEHSALKYHTSTTHHTPPRSTEGRSGTSRPRPPTNPTPARPPTPPPPEVAASAAHRPHARFTAKTTVCISSKASRLRVFQPAEACAPQLAPHPISTIQPPFQGRIILRRGRHRTTRRPPPPPFGLGFAKPTATACTGQPPPPPRPAKKSFLTEALRDTFH